VLGVTGTNIHAQIGAEQTPFSCAISTFFRTLVGSVLLVASASDYTERMRGDIFEDSAGPFLYGIMILLFLLVISIIGILFVVPLVIITILIWAAASALALSGIGGLISPVLGALGFGTILEDRYN
jgi:hypothetical protein